MVPLEVRSKALDEALLVSGFTLNQAVCTVHSGLMRYFSSMPQCAVG